jgi:hypothetical protein
MKSFFEETYGFFIPGIARSATNHVVDHDEDSGVVVGIWSALLDMGMGMKTGMLLLGRMW